MNICTLPIKKISHKKRPYLSFRMDKGVYLIIGKGLGLMKKLTAFILVFILVTSMQLPVFAAQASLSDIKGHWAEQNIEAAAADGWVNGFPDGSFKPDVTITRAEFVKLLLAAIHLTPESNSAKFLIGSAAYNLNKETALTDIDNHWLTSQGWFLIAESFGLIVPADYSEASFDPNKNCGAETSICAEMLFW